jgi:hypothetical protein
MYAVFPYISARGCFPDLNPLPHGHKGNSFTAALGLPFIGEIVLNKQNVGRSMIKPSAN